MDFVNANAEVYVPDGIGLSAALARVRGGCLAIGAHQDDLEIFAMHGIGACYERSSRMFAGVTVTNGGGSARKGKYADLGDAEMAALRHAEQNKAAEEGHYAAQFQLQYASADIKGAKPAKGAELVRELGDILSCTRPESVYAHNPFDKHETHIAVLRATVQALRALPEDIRPKHFYGCEVWRGLDWLPDEMKVYLDVTPYRDLQERLINCHESQIAGSKNYTHATLGREMANATYADMHSLDTAEAVTYAVDLKPLLDDSALTIEDFVRRGAEAFTKTLLAGVADYAL